MNQYLKRLIYRQELMLGFGFSVLCLCFFYALSNVKEWTLGAGEYILGFVAVVVYSYGLVFGGRYYFFKIRSQKSLFLSILLSLLYVPLVAYTGFVIALLKVYHHFALKSHHENNK